MRDVISERRQDDFELPGLKRRQLVEFSTDRIQVARIFLDSVPCARRRASQHSGAAIGRALREHRDVVLFD